MNSDKENTTPKVTESCQQVSALATPILSLSSSEQLQRHVQTSRDAIPASVSSSSVIAMSSATLSCGAYTMPPSHAVCTRVTSASQNLIERMIYSISSGLDRRGNPPTLFPRTSVPE